MKRRPVLMPALKLAVSANLDSLERELGKKIESCFSAQGRDFNEAKAFEYLRTYLREFYDCFFRFYSEFPAYKADWSEGARHNAVKRAIDCYKDHVGISAQEAQLIKERLWRDLGDHLEELATPKNLASILSDSHAAEYAKTGVDLSSGSPLLIMAATRGAKAIASQPKPLIPVNPVAVRRKQFVHPRLADKGWDVTMWAAKAKVTRHTANNYLEAKRKTYHDSLKKLADALGVSFQEFPR